MPFLYIYIYALAGIGASAAAQSDMESDLLLAVKSEDLDVFRSLVGRGSGVLSDVTPHGNTILHLAVVYGRRDLAEEICSLDEGYLLLWKANNKGETPLHYAAASDDPDALSWAEDVLGRLRLSGMQTRDVAVELLRARDAEGNTALGVAAARGRGELVRLMLDIHVVLFLDANDAGESPLYRAAVAGRREVVSLLLSCPSPSHRRGPCGRTVLHAAVRNCDSEMALMILKAMPQHKDEADDFGCTPMHYAVHSGDHEMVLHLIQNGSSAAYSLNNDGRSPLHEAAATGLLEAVQAMVSSCFDSTEVRDSKGKNALHIAVESGRHEVIKYLLATSTKLIKQRDADGNTPLHIASLRSDSVALFLLVQGFGVDLFAENRSGKTFVELATTEPTAANFFKLNDFLSILNAALVLKPTMSKALTSRYMETVRTGARLLYDWRMDKISIMATLIATVTFTAGLTAPGGFVSGGGDGKAEGTPTLAGAPAFKAFMVFDTLGLFFSLALIAFASVKGEVIERHVMGFVWLTGWFVGLSLTSLAMAFATGVYAVLAPQSLSLAIFVCVLCCAMLMLVWLPNFIIDFHSSYKTSYISSFIEARALSLAAVSPQTVVSVVS